VRVLVAEDDAVSRLILRRSLERLGHECVVASDGEEAWQSFQAGPVDVIISDWLMPGLDGIELCRRVRDSRTTAYTYFVFMTSLDDKRHFLTGMEAGADDYLTKPIDVEALQARLIAAARLTSLHQRLHEQNGELARLSKESHEAARTDALTMIGNRLRLGEDLRSLRARAARYGHRYAVALCDVDHFKRYNDFYGHLAGDRALIAVAGAISGQLRVGDAVYRYGDEEFLAILPEQTAEGASIAMERVRRTIEAAAVVHEARPTMPGVVTISVGISALAPDDKRSTDDWLKSADEALYRAKAGGRNRVAL
jgi:two-component system, cell cycle response regulator